MRFIYEQYQDLTEGYRQARKLDAEFRKHPVFIAWRKRQIVLRRNRLRYAGAGAAVFWLSLPCLLAASLMGSQFSYQWTEALSSLTCLATLFACVVAMAFTVCAATLAFSRGQKKVRWSVLRRWLNVVSTNYLPSQNDLYAQFLRNGNQDIEEYTRYGAKGVSQTLHHLTMALGDAWFTLTNVMLSASEDADIIIVGPSGIWILESKYWSGYINIEQNKWSRVRVYYKPGGYRQSEYTRIHKPWDDQWLRQRDAVAHILYRAQISLNAHAPSDLITGGIILSHQKARLNADGSQKAAIGNLSYWGSKMRQSETIERLSLEERLRVVDELLTTSRQNQKSSCECKLAVPLANQIFKEMLKEVKGSNRKNGIK